MFTDLEQTKKVQVLDIINTLFFGEGESKKSKVKKQQDVLKDLERNLAKIRTLGAEEIVNPIEGETLLKNVNG